MEEKVLIKSEKYNIKKAFVVMVIIGIILSVFVALSVLASADERYQEYYYEYHDTYTEHQEEDDCGWLYETWEKCDECEFFEKFPSKTNYIIYYFINSGGYLCFILIVPFALIGGLIYLWLRSYELTVTNKRIYGKVAWGKRVDLPVDSISATSTIRLFKGVSVSTASGRISFRVMKNADEIYNVVNNLLIERQQEKTKPEVVQTVQVTDEADQIKKYKDLLDSGVITQEEFDAKKKQLLGL